MTASIRAGRDAVYKAQGTGKPDLHCQQASYRGKSLNHLSLKEMVFPISRNRKFQNTIINFKVHLHVHSTPQAASISVWRRVLIHQTFTKKVSVGVIWLLRSIYYLLNPFILQEKKIPLPIRSPIYVSYFIWNLRQQRCFLARHFFQLFSWRLQGKNVKNITHSLPEDTRKRAGKSISSTNIHTLINGSENLIKIASAGGVSFRQACISACITWLQHRYTLNWKLKFVNGS